MTIIHALESGAVVLRNKILSAKLGYVVLLMTIAL